VSIAWVLLPSDLRSLSSEDEFDLHLKNKEHTYHTIIKPDGFVIGEGSIRIHQITNERAALEGIDFEEMVVLLRNVFNEVHTIVGHNLRFDLHVLASELYRRGHDDLVSRLFTMDQCCTMKLGQKMRINGGKWPKLSEMHLKLLGTELIGAHDAMNDTIGCARCLRAAMTTTQGL
jgi:DNA polymerase III epsilon subunit-like protein